MLRNGIIIFFFLSLFLEMNGQQLSDSLYYSLPQVEIISVPEQDRLRSLSSESNIDNEKLKKHQQHSLLSAINTAAGVRMEERSPGSYRLSIRGSLLRSPFGIRNVKVYLNDFPFTDAGGNTYLNILDVKNINSLKILKGPESCLFGANTGGALLINSVKSTTGSMPVNIQFSKGSYGMIHENAIIQKQWNKYRLSIGQGIQIYDGYRTQSAMKRHNLQVEQNLAYSKTAQLKAFILLSDLHYETPGGLTLIQYETNPRSARIATSRFPGAVEQKAGVYNKTIFTGITNDAFIYKNLRHIISVFGSHTDFENPFITNYELRKEKTYGLRTYFDLGSENSGKTIYRCNAGMEWQKTLSSIANHLNTKGMKDSLQTSDDVEAKQYFFFARFLADIHKRFLMEGSASTNFFGYSYRNKFPAEEKSMSEKNFASQFMPRLALSYKITENFVWRIAAGKGYSPPTISEIRSSDNIINNDLQAETGWNYEIGLRWKEKNNKVWIDITGFYFSIDNAIVRRVNTDDAEYFVNAGGTMQPGMEVQSGWWILKEKRKGFIRSCLYTGALTYSDFHFENYQVDNVDYSGKRLTGVPKWTTADNLNIGFPFGLNLFIQYYYSSRIALNNANTEFAKEYHLVQVKMQWKKKFNYFEFFLSAGADNIFDQKYSLGNDLNAAGGRFYNPAPGRNYYAGIGFGF